MNPAYQNPQKCQINSFRVTLADVKNSIDLVSLVRESGVELHQAGPGKLSGKCPFHSEKTPSFFVWTAKNRFKCFSCQASGDSFDFLKKTTGRSIKEILRDLSGGQWRPARPDPKRQARKEKEDRFQRWQADYSDDLSCYIGAINRFLFRACNPSTLNQYAHLIQARAQAERTLEILITGTRRDRIDLYKRFAGVSV